MSARSSAKDILPTTHFFITVARGGASRTIISRSWLILATVAMLPVLAIWLLGATAYILFHDDVVASLMLRQRDMQYAYEDRIAALTSQMNRDANRRLVDQRSLEAKVGELSARQADLQSRSGIVARLERQADRFARLSAIPSARQSAPTQSESIGFGPGTSTRGPPLVERAAQKPRPDNPLMTEPQRSSARDDDTVIPDRLAELSSQLDAVSLGQESRLAALDTAVRKSVSRYRDAIYMAGLTEDRLTVHADRPSGGPFVPLTHVDDASPFARATVGLQLTLSQGDRLASAIAHVPFGRPLLGDPEITSPFGERVDPFLGKPAMHTGIDLSQETGSEVHATAPGRITAAGPASGYGIMVEIEHGAGLATRYAHLSEAEVAIGQNVQAGQVIGRVGSTGRATGPHLHYETRIDGEAVDPIRFLAAGQQLAMAVKPL